MRNLAIALLSVVLILEGVTASELQDLKDKQMKFSAFNLESVKSVLRQLSNDIDSNAPSNAWISCSNDIKKYLNVHEDFSSWAKDAVTRTRYYIESATSDLYFKTSNRFGIHPLFVAAAQIAAGDLREGYYFILLTKNYMKRLYDDSK